MNFFEFNKGKTGLGYGALSGSWFGKEAKAFLIIFFDKISLNVQNLRIFSAKVHMQYYFPIRKQGKGKQGYRE